MNLSQLDGFGRVQTQTPMQFQGRGKTRRAKRKAKRQRRRSGQSSAGAARASSAGAARAVQKKAARAGQPTGIRSDIRPAGSSMVGKVAQAKTGHPKTKRAKRAQKMQKRRMQGSEELEMLATGSEPNIGFARVYQENLPGSKALQGFGRIKYTNRELQGLSLQGYTILQGYGMGDEDDLEDWNYLLSIEHPDTLQGFPSWVLQGKKERKARQAARKQKRAAKKATKQEKKTTRQTARTTKKEKRQERRGAGQARKQRRKEVRTAKKEERLQKKVSAIRS